MSSLLALLGRGHLPFVRLHGEPLYLHALRALAAVSDGPVDLVLDADQRARVPAARPVRSVRLLTVEDWWSRLPATPGDLLVHDPGCPLAPPSFLADVRRRGGRPGVSLVAFRPVTDTVKTVVADRIAGTIDRERLAAVASPILVAADVLAGSRAGPPPPVADFARLTGWLRARGQVELVKAPSLGRRVENAAAVTLLECVDDVNRRVHRA